MASSGHAASTAFESQSKSEITAEAVSAAVHLRVGELYWKQDGYYGWTLGQVTAFDFRPQHATFVLINEATGERLEKEEEQIEQHVELRRTPLFAANPLFSTAADMTSLRYLHEAALVKNLQDRSTGQTQCPYTFMANVLIAVNPLQQLSDPDKQVFVGQPLDHCPPHPYNVAEHAYRQLCAVRAVMQNQSIIISGESGSGKTETSKLILDFLTMRTVHHCAASTGSCTSTSDDEMDRVLTAPPGSLTSALSFPQFQSTRQLSPVAIGERLMATIPILESFGNATTHRNHNSSRFGKYMRLQFASDTYELAGASIDTYLLEKSRLVCQPHGERNFHIFYQLLHSDDTETLEHGFHLRPRHPEQYAYLNRSACVHSDFVDDAANFCHLVSALDFIGIPKGAQHEVFRLVAGLLHMGNIYLSHEDTDEGDTACIESNDAKSHEAVRQASELLGVSPEHLLECILHKRIMTRGSRRNSIYFIKRNVRNAEYARDTIAKTIYENTFTWLMTECAAALDYDAFRSDVVPFIGVLDIFGFEDFEPQNRNSFEQLLINYANETLQSLFNACIFHAEQELYHCEHIDQPMNHSLSLPFPLFQCQVTHVNKMNPNVAFLANQVAPSSDAVAYADNRECLTLLASRHGGLFATIDNVSRLPQPSDRKLNERLHTLFKRHACFPTPHPKNLRDTFLVRHYAGTVSYTINSFVDKNNNIISDQFEDLLKHSTSRVLQDVSDTSRPHNRARSDSRGSLQAATRSPLRGGASLSKRRKGGSTSNLFSTQMTGLTTELEGTSCSFVRCIKPNTRMQPGLFDRAFVVEQLRCSGTVQACEVLRVGLPTRVLYAEVVDVYRNLVPYPIFCRFGSNDKLFTQAILWAFAFPTSAFRMGDTRLFFRTGKIDLLDQLLTPADSTIELLSDQLLLYLRKKHWITVATAMVTFAQFKRSLDTVRYQRGATRIQCMVRHSFARHRVRTLRKQLRIHRIWTRLAHRAQTMHAFYDRPEDKIVLLTKLVARPLLPQQQRWLLTWLGPLQRLVYVQKRWNKVQAQYLAKRRVLWLFETVRRKRSAQLLQSRVRAMLDRRRVSALQNKARARRRWHLAFLTVKICALFQHHWHLVHVHRLEQDHATLSHTVATVTTQLREAQEEAKRAKVGLQHWQRSFDTVQMQVTQQQQRVAELELALHAKRLEVAELQRQITGGTFVERMIRFFTCSATMSPPSSPREVLMPSRFALLRRQPPIASEEAGGGGERIVWATPLSATLIIPQDEGALKRQSGSKELAPSDPEGEERRAKDADLLWSLSRYMA